VLCLKDGQLIEAAIRCLLLLDVLAEADFFPAHSRDVVAPRLEVLSKEALPTSEVRASFEWFMRKGLSHCPGAVKLLESLGIAGGLP
jgi:hypothetical protein